MSTPTSDEKCSACEGFGFIHHGTGNSHTCTHCEGTGKRTLTPGTKTMPTSKTMSGLSMAARGLLRQAHCPECHRSGMQSGRGCNWCLERAALMDAILAQPSPDETPEYRKWPGEPPHCMSCSCGMTDEQKRTVPEADYLRIHRELMDLKYPGGRPSEKASEGQL